MSHSVHSTKIVQLNHARLRLTYNCRVDEGKKVPALSSAESRRENAELRRESAEQTRLASEETRVEAEGHRQLVESVRQQREILREQAEAIRHISEMQRVEAEATRRTILEAMQATAESLDALTARMRDVEDMRQALYQLVGQTKNDRQ